MNVGDKDPCVNTMLIGTEPPFGDVKGDGSGVVFRKYTITSPAYPAGITLVCCLETTKYTDGVLFR